MGVAEKRTKGRHRSRWAFGAASASLLAAALGAALLGPGTSAALERNDGCPGLNPNVDISRGHDSATSRPQVFYIGDSISANPDQRAIYAQKNWDLHRWRTIVIAHGGAKIESHRCLNWLSFYYAHQSAAKAVVIELGTNDIYQIWDANYPFLFGHPPMPYNNRLLEISYVFNSMNWAANYLRNKCVVWVGLNQWRDSIADEKSVAKAFNDHLKALTQNHSNLHYADYTSLILNNQKFQDSLYKFDPRHPEYGHPDGIHPTYLGRWELGAWITGRVDHFCI
jgi:lysophospholipase L1-like esterase